MNLFWILLIIGFLVGGVRGLLFGLVLGYLASWMLRSFVGQKVAGIQAQFLESSFAVMGALCKADGVVTRDEIAAAEAMFDRLNLSAEQREQAKAAFNRGKSPDFDLGAEVAEFAAACRGQRQLMIMFLQIQLAAIGGDGQVHPAEHQMLVRVARLLGLSEADVQQLEALLRAGGRRGPGPAPKSTLDDAYAALGLTPSATDAQVKQAYRRLVSQNHPDKLASKGLPESMRQLAEERTREINTAYETIKAARGMT